MILKHLLLVLGGLLIINAAMSAMLWARYRTPLYRALFGLWVFGIGAGVAQALVQSDRWMVFAFGFGSFAVHLMLVDLVRRALNLQAHWRVYVWAFGVGVVASFAITWAGAPFWARALPVTVGSSLSLFDIAIQALRLPRRTISITGWSTILAVTLTGLHELSYVLRNNPHFATVGFMIALLVVFAVSISCPAVILERTVAEQEHSRDEIQRLNRQLELRVQETLAAVRGRDEFLSIASHELRTPLTSLKLQVALAQDTRPMSDSLRDRLNVVERQVVRLERLIDQLLDVSRIAKHRFELECSDGDLAALVQEVASELQPQIQRARSTLSVSVNAPVRGRWDLPRVEQVLTNLLFNAVKFGAGKPIEVRLDDQGDTAALRVTDHGIGISAKDQSQIFVPFGRATSARNYGGLGLGLWISSEIVKAHHGTIAVSSQPGQGATFTVLLPKRAC